MARVLEIETNLPDLGVRKHCLDIDAIEGYTEYPGDPLKLDIHCAGKTFEIRLLPPAPAEPAPEGGGVRPAPVRRSVAPFKKIIDDALEARD